MKNPNGYGSVIKLSGKRRRPFAARVTVGWDEDGKQVYEYLGYYETRQAAMIALALYNNDPYNLTAAKSTFSEIYETYFNEKFSEKRVPQLSKSSRDSCFAAYKNSSVLHSRIFKDIRTADLQGVIDDSGKGYSTKNSIKILFNQMYRHAMANDLTEKNYSAFVDIGTNTAENKSMPFSDEEIKRLWKSVGEIEHVDIILIMIYSGVRASEMLGIEAANVDIESRFMRGGIKTTAGKDRMIPLNMKIIPLIENRLNEGGEFIINYKNKQMMYSRFYRTEWKRMMKKLKMKQTPHDTRHTFATLMDNAGANKVSIQRIIGHASEGVTDKVYTHKNLEQLIKAIDLI